MPTTRFAPSPTGHLHLGHAYSAYQAFRAAEGEKFILRIEDIDPVRCKPEYMKSIIDDLHWLGLTWAEPIRYQSKHLSDYAAAMNVLKNKGLVYPCFCTRRDIEAEAQRAGAAPHAEDGSVLYPGTCRSMPEGERARRLAENPCANWRLDIAAAMSMVGPLSWFDRSHGKVEARPDIYGDVVLARKDVPTSYHLSVTVDDHLQGVTLVTRGEDLFDSTHIHRLLQVLLGYDAPQYEHHKLLTDDTGKRYAKRDRSVTLKELRASGKTMRDVLEIIMGT